MKYYKVLCFILLISASAYSETKNYEGYKVYKVIPQTADDVEALINVRRSGITEFWDDVFDVNHNVKIMVSAQLEGEFLEMLQKDNIEAKLVIDDVQSAIEDQITPVSRKKGSGSGGSSSGGKGSSGGGSSGGGIFGCCRGSSSSGSSSSGTGVTGTNGRLVYRAHSNGGAGGRRRRKTYLRNADTLLSFTWDKYHSLESIYSWLDELAETFPNIVKTVVIGQTVEGRDIKGIVLDYHPGRTEKKIGIFEGGLHAREWISPATVTWIIKEFLASDDPEVIDLASSFEWHFFSVVNPDGYSYTFTDRRMWRKNRSRANFTSCAASGVEDDMSNGVDLNRNFDFVWNTAGTSEDPCSNLFPGPSPASELETQAIQRYVLDLKEQGEILYYIAFHSYTQLVVVPHSHLTIDQALTVDNYADMIRPRFQRSTRHPDVRMAGGPSFGYSSLWKEFEIAARAAEVLERRNGTTYRVGLSVDVMYAMSGTSFDWAKNAADIPVAYLIELRDLGEYGFLLPAEQIIPNNLEIIDALLEMDRATRDLKYYDRSAAESVLTSLLLVAFGAVFAVFH